MTESTGERQRELVKMAAFAKLAGVPAPTIKFYIREGLLPPPQRRGGNTVLYDAALVPRVRAIKELQRRLKLPLKVVREVLDVVEGGELSSSVVVEATVARVLAERAPRDRITRAQVLEQGVSEDDLKMCSRLDLLSEEDPTGYEGEDAALTRVLGQARRAGLTVETLPPRVLQAYVRAVSALVRAELDLFRHGVLPRAGEEDLIRLTEAAAILSERLVVVLRRKLMLPTLRDMFDRAGRSWPVRPSA
jgi:DNA-binding transcriptional MerR regulator